MPLHEIDNIDLAGVQDQHRDIVVILDQLKLTGVPRHVTIEPIQAVEVRITVLQETEALEATNLRVDQHLEAAAIEVLQVEVHEVVAATVAHLQEVVREAVEISADQVVQAGLQAVDHQVVEVAEDTKSIKIQET